MSIEQISQDYDAHWFQHFDGLKDEFVLVADAIFEQFQPRYCIDLGCGPGLILDRLHHHYGVHGFGVEGSIHGLAAAPPRILPRIICADITAPESIVRLGEMRNDEGVPAIVICTEVAEHVPAEKAGPLVAAICAPKDTIIFTAAPPGQGGHHHINEQPMEYWLTLFAVHGVSPDWEATAALKERWKPLIKLAHMTRNVIVLK